MSRIFAARPLSLLACFVVFVSGATLAQRSYDVDILTETFGFNSKTPRSVPLSSLHQGCAARDCIPSIDDPKFVSAVGATHVADQDVVIAIAWRGEYRAYPTRILDQHEIVNDTIAGTPIAITYCPLCGSAVGVHREIAGAVTELGVSGLLYNSDLVFYDRRTETLWDQIEATGIVGPLTGEKLEFVPLTMTRWSRWRDAHPDTLILSADTGFGRDYSKDHYASYRSTDKLMFPVSEESKRISPKATVFGFEIDEMSVAYAEDLLVKSGSSYSHELDGSLVTVTLADDGSVLLEFVDSGKTYEPIQLFWFAWYTFHPKTKLFH
jgi:hypothetical protein